MRSPIRIISLAVWLLVAGCKPSENPPGPPSQAAPPAPQVPETAAKPEPNPQVIRVMTFNIHHGRGLDGKVDIERQANVIKEANPDVVGVQELDRNVARSGGIDEIGELARLTGMTFYFDKNIDFQGGEYGNAVLTRLPILLQTNSYYKSMHPGERRAVQQVVLDAGGRKVVLLNTHMDYRPEDEERLRNIDQLESVMTNYTGLPMILTGDLNDDPGSRTHKRFKELFADAWELAGQGDGFTYVGHDRSKRLDYILLSNTNLLEVVAIRVIDTGASDHKPVVADIRLK